MYELDQFGDRAAPVASGRALAALFPGAEFVLLHEQNHLFLEDEPECEAFYDRLGAFLRWSGPDRLRPTT
jgi:hypothetical protein